MPQMLKTVACIDKPTESYYPNLKGPFRSMTTFYLCYCYRSCHECDPYKSMNVQSKGSIHFSG